VVVGEVTKITNFGVFVKLEDSLEGLLHISELADRKVASAEEVVQVGDRIAVKILRVDPENRKIGLSLKDVTDEQREAAEAEAEARWGAQKDPGAESGAPPAGELETAEVAAGAESEDAGTSQSAPGDGDESSALADENEERS
jgi:small subunit ribosomal protein S1